MPPRKRADGAEPAPRRRARQAVQPRRGATPATRPATAGRMACRDSCAWTTERELVQQRPTPRRADPRRGRGLRSLRPRAGCWPIYEGPNSEHVRRWCGLFSTYSSKMALASIDHELQRHSGSGDAPVLHLCEPWDSSFVCGKSRLRCCPGQAHVMGTGRRGLAYLAWRPIIADQGPGIFGTSPHRPVREQLRVLMFKAFLIFRHVPGRRALQIDKEGGLSFFRPSGCRGSAQAENGLTRTAVDACRKLCLAAADARFA